MRRTPLWALPLVLLAMAAAVFAVGLAAFLGVAAVAAFVEAPWLDLFAGDATDWRFDLSILLLTSGLLVAVVVSWVRRAERRSLASIGLPRRGWRAREAVWLALGAVWALVAVSALRLFDEEADVFSTLAAYVEAPGVAVVALLIVLPVAVIAAAAEEVLFRGWLLTAIATRAGMAWAVGVSSLLFALVHFLPSQLVAAPALTSLAAYAFAGAAFAVIALREGRLSAAIAFHAGYNALLFALTFADYGFDPNPVMADVMSADRGSDNVPSAVAWLALEAALLLALLLVPWRNVRPAP